jgi:ubiquinone biosynthesis protein
VAQGLRRLPRLIDSLHVVAEHERRQAERAEAAPSPTAGRGWRPRFAEIIAVLALLAAIAAWWH